MPNGPALVVERRAPRSAPRRAGRSNITPATSSRGPHGQVFVRGVGAGVPTDRPSSVGWKEKAARAYMWVSLGDDEHPYNIYDFSTSRNREGPINFLGNYDQV